MRSALMCGFFCVSLMLISSCAGTTSAGGKTKFEVPESKKDCGTCHVLRENRPTAGLKKPISALCAECHPDRMEPAEHKVNVVPSMRVKGLPLADGKITCATCHDPHKNPYGKMLRVKAKELCLTCHKY